MHWFPNRGILDSKEQISRESADTQRWLDPVKVDTIDFELAQQFTGIFHSVGQISEMTPLVVVSGLRECSHPESRDKSSPKEVVQLVCVPLFK